MRVMWLSLGSELSLSPTLSLAPSGSLSTFSTRWPSESHVTLHKPPYATQSRILKQREEVAVILTSLVLSGYHI